MDIYDQFMNLFEQAIERAGNLKRLAEITGINYPTLFRWSKRESIPNLETIRPLLPYLKNMDLLDVEGPTPVIQDISKHKAPEVIDEAKTVRVPVMAEVGAGVPIEVWEQEPIEWISIMPEYVRDDLRVFKVSGDSMSPTIKKGAYVGVTPLQDVMLKEGQIYLCYNPPFGIVVKRVRPGADNSILLLSDNPEYEPVKVNMESYQKVVLGEVRWVMQNV